ncbi:DUF6159 family protein [Petrachloros mirabilis]
MPSQSSWIKRVVHTQTIMSAAWSILNEHKSLLLLPLASSATLILLTLSIVMPTVVGILTGVSVSSPLFDDSYLTSVVLFFLYVVFYAIGIFFNSALAFCVLQKLDGKHVSIGDGLREATACLSQIVGWAIVSATVGLLLKAVEHRSGWIGSLVVKTIGMAWTVATFLVVPILVAEKKGPIDAVQESVQLLRRTWGENLFARLGFGVLYFLWSLPALFAFLFVVGTFPSHPVIAVVVMACILVYVPSLGLVFSTMSTIFDVVLYRYARLGTPAVGFDQELLKSCFVTKSA